MNEGLQFLEGIQFFNQVPDLKKVMPILFDYLFFRMLFRLAKLERRKH
jgi:hypothetical protein